jgi:dipeptidase E
VQQIIAIGGGGYASRASDIVLEAHILAQANAARPKVCYLPQAGGESRDYIVRFYEAFTRLGAQPSWFSLFGRVAADWPAYVLSHDVLYVGGGNTRSMLALWHEWGVDHVLRDALAAGIVLSGVSAGAICWFAQGITDSGDQMGVLDCLGILEGSCCPHYDSASQQSPTYRALVAEDRAMPGLALTDGAAAHFVDGQLGGIVTPRPEARGYHLAREDGTVVERELPATYLG